MSGVLSETQASIHGISERVKVHEHASLPALTRSVKGLKCHWMQEL